MRRVYFPALPWEAVGAALTAGTVVAYQEIGLAAIGLLAVVLISCAYLLRLAVDASRERDELRLRVGELEALHHGVIRVMVETLGMRDRMTARHSAAVARYAKATAAAMKLGAREQELVHTAGLVHDVGKFTFPDHTLTGNRLTEDDWELIRSHPQRGADIVGNVDGYAEVAEIILRQHERIDGHGYPNNLAGDDIPLLARILAVADCFDVMTARDSYRAPMSFDAAFAELRRVGGTQLDAQVVEVFIDLHPGRRGGRPARPTATIPTPSSGGRPRGPPSPAPRTTERRRRPPGTVAASVGGRGEMRGMRAAVVLLIAIVASVVAAPAGAQQHSLRSPITDENFYFVMADRFENGDTGNDLGGLSGDRAVTGFDPTGTGWYHGGDLKGLTPEDRLHPGSGHRLDLAHAELQEQRRAAAGQQRRLPRLLDHGLHPDRPAPRHQRRISRDLIGAAHRRGMKVYFDIITNHTADVIGYEGSQRKAYVSKDEAPYKTASGTPFDDRDFAGDPSFPRARPRDELPARLRRPARRRSITKVPAWLNDPIYYHNRGDTTFYGEDSLYGDFFGLDDLFTEHPRRRRGHDRHLQGVDPRLRRRRLPDRHDEARQRRVLAAVRAGGARVRARPGQVASSSCSARSSTRSPSPTRRASRPPTRCSPCWTSRSSSRRATSPRGHRRRPS